MAEPARVIMVTPDELRAIVREELRAELGKQPTVANDTALLATQQAAEYCSRLSGKRITKRTILEHVAKGRLVPDAPARPGFPSHRFKRSTLDKLMAGEE